MCLGAVLARLEGTIAIGRLVSALDGLARDGAHERGGRARFRGFNRYPIAWERAHVDCRTSSTPCSSARSPPPPRARTRSARSARCWSRPCTEITGCNTFPPGIEALPGARRRRQSLHLAGACRAHRDLRGRAARARDRRRPLVSTYFPCTDCARAIVLGRRQDRRHAPPGIRRSGVGRVVPHLRRHPRRGRGRGRLSRRGPGRIHRRIWDVAGDTPA